MADYLQYANQGAKRALPIDDSLINAMAFLGDMGVTMRVVSGGQASKDELRAEAAANGLAGSAIDAYVKEHSTGSDRHDHGKSADVDFYKDGRKLDWNNADDLPTFQTIVKNARANGITGIGAGDDYMGAGRMHIGYGPAAVWGADGKGANAPSWLRAAYDGAPQGVSGGGGADTMVGQAAEDTLGLPAIPQALQDAYDAGRLTPEMRAAFEAKFMPAPVAGGTTAPTPTAPPLPTARFIPIDVASAYAAGTMDPDKRARLDSLLTAGQVALPTQTAIDNWNMTPKGVDPAGAVGPGNTRGTFDRTRELGGDMLNASAQYAAGATGLGPSVTAQQLPDAIPEVARRVIGGGADLGMAALTGVAGLSQGAAGLVGDAADAFGMNPASADRLSYDLAAMPDAFAGSPGMVTRPGANLPRTTPEARPVAQAAARVEPPVTALPDDPATVGRLVSQASRTEKPNASQRRLAAGMDIDPEAKAAADSLGFDLPPDVMSNNQQIREAAGLTRSQAGTSTSASWRDTVARASDRALEVMGEIKSTNLSEISERVKTSLRATRDDLNTQAGAIYDQIGQQVGKRAIIEPNNMVRSLNETIMDLGGEAGMSKAERDLFALVTGDQPITYERLSRERRAVGRAISRGDGPYADADQASLNRIYGAMAEDQLANVERLAGPEARANLEAANALYTQQKDLEGTIVSAFGKDGEGSIASKLVTAVNGGAKRGDISGLNRVLNAIPKDLRGEAMATAIGHVASSTGSTASPFNFAAYSSMYKGMRDNPAVYSRVIGELGPEADGILRGLYVVSDRVTKARANVLTTGKANQSLVNSLTADGLVNRVMETSIGRRATQGAATMAGAAAGGAPGAVAGNAIAEALAKGGRNHIDQAGRMFSSPEFQRLVTEAATQATPSRQAINGVTNSAPYRRWARASGIQNPDQWLAQAVIMSTQATAEPNNVQ
jgi:uncharacterized protein (DUF697 family)